MSGISVGARFDAMNSDARWTTAEVDALTNAVATNLIEQEYFIISVKLSEYQAQSAQIDRLIQAAQAQGASREQALTIVTGGTVTIAQYDEDIAARNRLQQWVSANSPNTDGGTFAVVMGAAATGAAAGGGIGLLFGGVGIVPGYVLGGVGGGALGLISGIIARVID